MNHFSALKEIYFKEHIDIAFSLGAAIKNDNTEALELIIEKYFNTKEAKCLIEGEIALLPTDDENARLISPAAIAIEYSNLKALGVILKFTGNPNARLPPNHGNESATLLMHAAKNGNYDLVKYLLEFGAKTDEIYIFRQLNVTALSFAIENGFLKTLDLLIEHGAKATAADLLLGLIHYKPHSSAHVALLNSNPTIINQSSLDDNLSMLCLASKYGDIEAVQWLLSHGAKTQLDSTDVTPLHLACFEGHLEIVKLLLAHGANLYATTKDGTTPAVCAIANEKTDVVNYLNAAIRTKTEITNSTVPACEPDDAIDLLNKKLEELKSQLADLQDTSENSIEITDKVERFELLEEKFSIIIRACSQ